MSTEEVARVPGEPRPGAGPKTAEPRPGPHPPAAAAQKPKDAAKIEKLKREKAEKERRDREAAEAEERRRAQEPKPAPTPFPGGEVPNPTVVLTPEEAQRTIAEQHKVTVRAPPKKATRPPRSKEEEIEFKRYDWFERFVTEKLPAIVVPLIALPDLRSDYLDDGGVGEFLDGETLRDHIAAGKVFSARRAIEFATEPGAINMFGLRSIESWEYKVSNYADGTVAYDDWIVQVWIDEDGTKHCEGVKGSVDPGEVARDKGATKAHAQEKDFGKGFGKRPTLERNYEEAWRREVVRHAVAHLCEGQWRYKLGHHPQKGGKPAGNQQEEVVVWRNPRRDDLSDVYTEFNRGWFGVHIHWAGAPKDSVKGWSAGCQVVAGGHEGENWRKFIARIQAAPNQADFPYTLLDRKQIAKDPIPVEKTRQEIYRQNRRSSED